MELLDRILGFWNDSELEIWMWLLVPYMVFKVITGEDHHENEHGWRRQKDQELISKAWQHHKLEEKRKSQRKETNKLICEVGGKAREHKVSKVSKTWLLSSLSYSFSGYFIFVGGACILSITHGQIQIFTCLFLPYSPTLINYEVNFTEKYARKNMYFKIRHT